MSTTTSNYSVPTNLPGFTFHDPRKQDYRKGQFLKVTAGLMGARGPTAATIDKQIDEHTKTITLNAPTMTRETFPEEYIIPNEEVVQYNVLRFFAYFRETVPESADEELRVRYVSIYVYLEDNTIMIEEHKKRNAGMEQGVLLRRMRAANPRAEQFGSQYIASDFNIGINVEIYGVTYHIYACDQFTEAYFQNVGIPLHEFEEPPDDLYSIKRRLTERPIRVTHIDTDKTHLKQFLENDGKVLRFYTYWDDTKSLFGEKRKFILHYFLVDDTIEIRQMLPPNSGRDPVSQFLKKTKLVNPETNSPYTPADLKIGTPVEVFGRQFIIFDCDGWTRQYINQTIGPRDWTPLDYGAGEGQGGRKERIFPEYNGWGDEEDSLGYCISLHPKPPRKNVVKLIAKDGHILRFAARFKNPDPQDQERDFIIAFYLADDTVAVFERPKRNSGFAEGKFIQRSSIKNSKAGYRKFMASDFRVGQEVTINSYTFVVYDADEYTLKYMEAEADDFPQSDLFEIVRSLQGNRQLKTRLRQEFERFDPKLEGRIGEDQAIYALEKITSLQEHEIITIVRRWSEYKEFDYYSFMCALA